MPQPSTHYLVAQNALMAEALPLWNSFGQYLGFGSFGPDLFYLNDGKISDIIHGDNSFDYFCAMLNFIKENYVAGTENEKKLKSFAYGWYSHVVTDCVIHPYVYRKTRDNWKTHPEITFTAHKLFEAFIDIKIQDIQGLTEPLVPNVKCSSPSAGICLTLKWHL